MVTTLEQANEVIQQQHTQIEELSRQLTSAQHQVNTLQHQVEQLLRRIYGRRSEKMDPNQLMFDNLLLEALEHPAAPKEDGAEQQTDKAPAVKRSRSAKRRHPGRLPIPEHLERVEVILDIPDKDKLCPETGKPLKRIGWEVSEKLEYRPGKLLVNVYKRPKYAAAGNDSSADVGVITAPMPDHPIEKCKADVGLLSQVIVGKFADHLPLYR